MHRSWQARRFWLVCGCLVVLGVAASGDERLLSPSKDQLPADIGSDDRTKVSIAERDELGGKCLKVVRLPGDSFGSGSVVAVSDWRPFTRLKFTAFNPGPRTVRLGLNVIHAGTTDYPTRVDTPVTLRPGKNSVSLRISRLRNVNGSQPDWETVSRWFLACDEDEPATTLYFGDFILEGATGEEGERSTSFLPAGRYKITGKIGEMEVDLRLEPIQRISRKPNKSASRDATPIRADPERLARIRKQNMPTIREPVMFDTPEADRIASALEVFPRDHPFNQTIGHWPVHPNSAAIIASIGNEKPLRYNPDMAYIFVPPSQPKIPVSLTMYPDESDPGPYPVPRNVPLEGWPAGFSQFHAELNMTLDALQTDQHNLGGDRHALIVDPANRILYEFYQMKRTRRGWQASSAAIFDLKTNKSRPDGWTSSDAAGLPVFPAVVRHDELQRGEIEHAMRVTVRRTRRAYVAPATHYASSHTDRDLPRMGERLRLRADFDISPFSPAVQTILRGLKKYGMYVADNGLDWAISVAPDPRIPDMHAELRRVPGSAFEVVAAPWDPETK